MKYTVAQPYFPSHEINRILEEFRSILSGEGMLSMGDHVTQFENEVASYIGKDYAIATNSCSATFWMVMSAPSYLKV